MSIKDHEFRVYKRGGGPTFEQFPNVGVEYLHNVENDKNLVTHLMKCFRIHEFINSWIHGYNLQ